MPLRIVQSKQNGRLKELRSALAHPGRDERGLAGIEGPNLIEEAVRAGLRMPTVFWSLETQDRLETLALPAETEVLLVPRDLLASVLATETPQPVAAFIEPPEWTWDHILGGHSDTAPLIVVLAGLQDPGNLGTIVRSAEAFGATGVICLPGTVSAWNPKAVRASAGSLFRVPMLVASAEETFERLLEAGVRVFATALLAGKAVNDADLAASVALIIGNEGNGVPADIAAQASGSLTIPCPGPVESLNAAVAASVLLYEASRQRALQGGQHRPPKRGWR